MYFTFIYWKLDYFDSFVRELAYSLTLYLKEGPIQSRFTGTII